MQSAAHANQIRTLMVWMLTFVDLMQVSGNYVSLLFRAIFKTPLVYSLFSRSPLQLCFPTVIFCSAECYISHFAFVPISLKLYFIESSGYSV